MLVIAFILSVATGLISEYLYHHSADRLFSEQRFTEALHNTIIKSDKIIDQVIATDTLFNDPIINKLISASNNIAFFAFEDENLIFWNTNQYQADIESPEKDGKWHFTQLSNAFGIYKWYDIHEGTGILAFIPVKSDFPYENDYLRNVFHERFDTDKQIGLSENTGYINIKGTDGSFLFSLNPTSSSTENKFFSTLGFVAFSFSFLLLLIIFFNINHFLKTDKLSQGLFWKVTIAIGVIISACCYFNFPGLFFSNGIFYPHHYAANQLINTFTHLSIICLFLVTSIAVYLLKVDKKTTVYLLQKACLLLYIFIYFEIIKSLILHSNINFNIAALRDIHFINIWAQFLIFILGTGVYFLLLIINDTKNKITINKKKITTDTIFILASITIYYLIFKNFTLLFALLIISVVIFDYINNYFNKHRFSFSTFGVFLLIISIITLLSSYWLSEYKKDIKYKIQAENILVNGNAESDPIAELLLEELDKNLQKDDNLTSLIQYAETAEINKFIYDKYLHGFWNKYNIQIYPVAKNAPETTYFLRFLESTGKKIKSTGFYSLPASLYDLSFIGLIDISNKNKLELITDQTLLVFEFQPKRNFRSYSFPDLLISRESDIFKQTGVSIAKYENSHLTYSDLHHDWFETDVWFQNLHDGFGKIAYANKVFYVFTKENTRIVITEIMPFSFRNLIFYSLFIFIICIFVARIVYWLYEIKMQKRQYALGLTSKFQLVFISLLFSSFIGILIFSVNYIRSNYRQEQIASLEKKKQYLQKSLQDLYYWTEDITAVDEQSLNNHLLELAYKYQTDINIYNNAGKLMGSSQSLIFSKNLISDRISPAIIFSDYSTENQYEKIGELEYLAAYTDLINGDFLQIGYISIPQYFSQTEINAKIEQFLGAIIQIYLIIIILSVILILFTGRQLAEPLRQLESKMKSMRLGGKNEKVEYKSKDEIGQLVEQYNRTVDELEKSTQLLLTSERETAWRTMARQVAHEINNPLTPMKLTIQQLLRTKKLDTESFDVYFEKAAHTLIEQIDNLSRIAGTFSQFARMPETKFSDVDIAKKLVSVVSLFRHNHDKIEINYTGPENKVIVSGDSDQLIQVFNNIMKNATQSIKKGAKGKIDVSLEQTNDDILITITDNGTGIPEAIHEDIFKPSFTTKSTGMGLGLSISKNIIENMGGKISFTTKENKGTSFEIRLNNK